jgi:hypothetical protein
MKIVLEQSAKFKINDTFPLYRPWGGFGIILDNHE